MLSFKRNIKSEQAPGNVAGMEFYNKYKILKQKFALYLQRKTDVLSLRSKKYIVISFCLLFGGSSIAITIHATLTKDEVIKIANLIQPTHINDSSESTLQGDSIITKTEYERIIRFKNSLLHLKDDSSGRKRFDSIMQMRPQLLDSIALFEKLYLSQK